jgi:16S rRNA (cytosine967-C5)-methyltransferase
MTPRHLALEILLAVVNKGESLSAVAPRLLVRTSDSRNRALAYRLTLDTLRSLNRFSWIRDQLLERAFTGKDMDVALLLTLGIAQLCDPDLPVHASLNETVEVARTFKKKPWAVGLVNGVLRNFQRRQDELISAANKQDPLFFSHPQWLLTQLQQTYPNTWRSIAHGNNTPADLCLRLAPRINPDDYLQQLPAELKAQQHPHLSHAILLDSTDVTALAGFDTGDFSVQDANAQWAAHILQPQAGESILDACAAPGGKTTHLLELSNNQAQITALDIEEKRLARIQENLDRLGLTARLMTANAADTKSWWNGQLFDAILLDAPCSATGIIRRHPDIKWHRKPRDIEQLTHTQAELLDALWLLLKPNGRLLYATCSILAAENSGQVRAFLERTTNARLQPLTLANGQDTGFGTQFLPIDAQHGDGFFYALLNKEHE